MKNEESKAIRRFCGAILEYRNTQPYKNHIKKAIEDTEVGAFPPEIKELLTEAVILNVVNRKEYPFDLLRTKFSLPVSANEFRDIKTNFCQALAARCGFPDEGGMGFSKKNILDMLLSIAGEANDCMITDGEFNHQVAGVALKAIDQAVKLSGLYDNTGEEAPQSITMDKSTQKLGA